MVIQQEVTTPYDAYHGNYLSINRDFYIRVTYLWSTITLDTPHIGREKVLYESYPTRSRLPWMMNAHSGKA